MFIQSPGYALSFHTGTTRRRRFFVLLFSLRDVIISGDVK